MNERVKKGAVIISIILSIIPLYFYLPAPTQYFTIADEEITSTASIHLVSDEELPSPIITHKERFRDQKVSSTVTPKVFPVTTKAAPVTPKEHFRDDQVTTSNEHFGDGKAPSLHEPLQEALVKENNGMVRIEMPNKLPQSIIDGVKTFVFFLGHGRSGHSIVGSLMDSHPNMVIASEVDVFARLSDGSLAPSKQEIFNTLWINSKMSIMNGLRAKSTNGKGYDLLVDGLYEGRYVDHIDVIGDKKGGITSDMLATKPEKWLHVYNILKSLNVTIKVIFVIRNPYDNIATDAFYGFNANPNNFGGIKQSSSTYKINPAIIQRNIVRYFSYHQAIADGKKKYNLNIVEIHGKDLISDPRGTLMRLCNSLGVTCSNTYLEICSKKIFKTESRTRHLVKWTDKQLLMIQQNIRKYRCLKGYTFDSM